MANHDLDCFIRRECTTYKVDYDTLDDNIKTLVDALAESAYDAKRMQVFFTPHQSDQRSPRATTHEELNPYSGFAKEGTT